METATHCQTHPAHAYPMTHPRKVLFRAQGITKQELLDYYAMVAEPILPHVANRPLTPVSCPSGGDPPRAFQEVSRDRRVVRAARATPIRGAAQSASAHNILADSNGLCGLVAHSGALSRTIRSYSGQGARRGRTLIDYLQNARGKRFIAPDSTRATDGAPIAVPLEWDELSPKLPPEHFNLRNIGKRLSLLRRDPFERLVSHVQRPMTERDKP